VSHSLQGRVTRDKKTLESLRPQHPTLTLSSSPCSVPSSSPSSAPCFVTVLNTLLGTVLHVGEEVHMILRCPGRSPPLTTIHRDFTDLLSEYDLIDIPMTDSEYLSLLDGTDPCLYLRGIDRLDWMKRLVPLSTLSSRFSEVSFYYKRQNESYREYV
jgi:hypothetical protein